MEIKKVKLSALRLNPNNPRLIKDFKFQKLVKSILTFPKMLELREIVTDETMMVLGGNMRFRALQHIAKMTEQELRQQLKSYDIEELTDYWMTWHDCPMESVKIARGLTDEQKQEFIAKDNVAYGEWDWDMLANEWDTDKLTDWGVDIPVDWGNDAESKEMEKEAEEDDFDEEKEDIPAICQKGDIWILGKHRLMCGDSTSIADIDTLLEGDIVRMVVTSPPYGVGKDYEEKGINPWFKTIGGVINAIKNKALIVCWNIGDLYSTGSQFTEPTGAYSISLLKDAGYGMLYNRIWKKPGANFAGNNPYYTVTTKPAQDYEYLFAFAELDADRHLHPIKDYLFTEAKKANINNTIIRNIGGPSSMYGHWFTNHQWTLIDKKNYQLIQSYCKSHSLSAFERDYDTIKDEYLRKTIFSHRLSSEDFSEWGLYGVWEFNTVTSRLGGHAAAFPLELPTRFIKIHSYPQDKVLDPFGGTGTTLIACEQLDRKCYMMELDPHYCDVIIARWEKLTGNKAIKKQ